MKRTTNPLPLKTSDISKDLLPDSLQQELIRFFEYHPPSRFSKNLRSMLLEHLMHDGAVEANYLKDLLFDLEGLFEVLDAAEAAEKAREGNN